MANPMKHKCLAILLYFFIFFIMHFIGLFIVFNGIGILLSSDKTWMEIIRDNLFGIILVSFVSSFYLMIHVIWKSGK